MKLNKIGTVVEADSTGSKGVVVGYQWGSRGFPVDIEEKTYFHPDYEKRIELPKNAKVSEQIELLDFCDQNIPLETVVSLVHA